MSTRAVLIIEDDEMLLSVIQELLKLEGLNVHIARDAESGIQLMTETQPNLIVCDINLLQGSGYEVFEALQGDNLNNTPFLFMTATNDTDKIQQKTSIEYEKIIIKPFNVAEFLAIVRRWV
jgi:DNA-binding response OmpR family regulator